MEIFAPFLLCVVFLAVMYGLMRLALWFSKLSARRNVYQSGIYTPTTVHTLLLAQFGEKAVLSKRSLPYKTECAVAYEACDHILFLNGAVVIVTVCCEEGKVQNLSYGEAWHSRIRNKAGAEKEVMFENPITAGERKKQALTSLLKRAKCRFRTPVHHIVIFPSRRVRFSLPRQEQIMSAPEALRKLKELDQKMMLSKEQKKILKSVVKRGTLTNTQTEKIMSKKKKAEAPKPTPKPKVKTSATKKKPTLAPKTAQRASVAPAQKATPHAQTAKQPPQPTLPKSLPKTAPTPRPTDKRPQAQAVPPKATQRPQATALSQKTAPRPQAAKPSAMPTKTTPSPTRNMGAPYQTQSTKIPPSATKNNDRRRR